MIKRMPTNCGDKTCPSCVIAGDFIFLAHHKFVSEIYRRL